MRIDENEVFRCLPRQARDKRRVDFDENECVLIISQTTPPDPNEPPTYSSRFDLDGYNIIQQQVRSNPRSKTQSKKNDLKGFFLCVFSFCSTFSFLPPRLMFGQFFTLQKTLKNKLWLTTFQDRLTEIAFVPNLPNGFENSHDYCRKHTISIAAGPAIITRAIWSFRFRSENAPFSRHFILNTIQDRLGTNIGTALKTRGCGFVQHPTPYYDDSYAVNSASMGPWYALLPHTHTHTKALLCCFLVAST
eukprot:COSAG06_NODE_977_length_11246_cov_599.741724_7_plen_248_part_00